VVCVGLPSRCVLQPSHGGYVTVCPFSIFLTLILWLAGAVVGFSCVLRPSHGEFASVFQIPRSLLGVSVFLLCRDPWLLMFFLGLSWLIQNVIPSISLFKFCNIRAISDFSLAYVSIVAFSFMTCYWLPIFWYMAYGIIILGFLRMLPLFKAKMVLFDVQNKRRILGQAYNHSFASCNVQFRL